MIKEGFMTASSIKQPFRYSNATDLAAQISTLDGFKKLRTHQPHVSRKSVQWSTQLHALCERVDLLSEKIADGERVSQELLQRVDRRIDKLASEQCTRETHQIIVRAQQSVRNILSVNNTFAHSPKTTPFVPESVIPAFRPGWKSWLMQGLYFQGALGLGMSPQTSSTTSALCNVTHCTPTDRALTYAEIGGRAAQSAQLLPSLSLTTEHKPLCASTGKQSEPPAERWSFQPVYDFFNWLRGSSTPRNRNCLTPDCPDLDKDKLEEREKELVESVFFPIMRVRIQLGTTSLFDRLNFQKTQEWLRFRRDDPRDKLLVAVSVSDGAGVSDPKNSYQIFRPLNEMYDIKYVVIKSLEELCSEIQQATKTGKLAHVLIESHGNPEAITIYEGTNQINRWSFSRGSRFSDCFSGMEPAGKILLISCSTGKPQNGNPFDNIATSIADDTKKTVIAPTDDVYPSLTTISSESPLNLHHEHIPNWRQFKFVSTNFRAFFSRYPSCDGLSENRLHPREQLAIRSIQDELIRKGFLHETPSFQEMQDYLRLCKDDPKKKFLYLQAQEDPTGFLNPSHFSSLLVDIADKFDLKFKVIQQDKEICDEVKLAIDSGNLAAVLIQAHGKPNQLNITATPFSWLQRTYEMFFGGTGIFPDCLARIPSSARIILLAESTGADPTEEFDENLATKIARKIQRTVIAPTKPIHIDKVSLKSCSPVEVHHPTSGVIFDSSGNVFKQFDP